MSTVLEQLTRSEADSQAAAMERYREIVVALANDNDPELESVQKVLQQTGKTAKQLAADVRELQSLGASIDEMISAAVSGHERAEVLKKIQAAEAEFQKMALAHRQKLLPLQARAAELADAQMAGITAKGQFVDSYCKNHHHNSASTNSRNGELVGRTEALVAQLGKLEYEIKRSGGGRNLQDDKAAAIERLNELKLKILDHAKNLHTGY